MTHAGCLSASHTNSFFSALFRMEVWIRSDDSCPIVCFVLQFPFETELPATPSLEMTKPGCSVFESARLAVRGSPLGRKPRRAWGKTKRKDRDSNPGNSCPFTAFRVRPDRPLRHLSFFVPQSYNFFAKHAPRSGKKMRRPLFCGDSRDDKVSKRQAGRREIRLFGGTGGSAREKPRILPFGKCRMAGRGWGTLSFCRVSGRLVRRACGRVSAGGRGGMSECHPDFGCREAPSGRKTASEAPFSAAFHPPENFFAARN